MGLSAFKYYASTPPFVINKKYKLRQKEEMRKNSAKYLIKQMKPGIEHKMVRSKNIIQNHTLTKVQT